MTFINSLSVALILITIVFIVLGVLFTILRLQTSILGNFKSNENKPANNTANNAGVNEKAETTPKQMEISAGELELIGVNEETAAMVMAMASYELNIPLNELQFKSIKALD